MNIEEPIFVSFWKLLYSIIITRSLQKTFAKLDIFYKKAYGDYYTIIGSDDLIKEDYIEKCVNFINQKNPLCFQSDLLWFSNNQILRQTNHRYSNLQNFKQQLLTRCCVNTPTVFYKKDLLEKFNLKTNPIEFSGANDYDLYCQIADSDIIVENAENWLGYLYRENEHQCTWQMHKQSIPYDYLIQSKWKKKWEI